MREDSTAGVAEGASWSGRQTDQRHSQAKGSLADGTLESRLHAAPKGHPSHATHVAGGISQVQNRGLRACSGNARFCFYPLEPLECFGNSDVSIYRDHINNVYKGVDLWN